MFKMNLKKALALLASVLMLCSLVPVGALLSANADSNNVVVNGGFESGEDNWTFNSGSHEIVTDAHSGDKALSLTNPGLWAEGAVQTVSVSANSEYTITWYSKRVAGVGAFNLYTMNANGYANLESVSGQNWMNEKSGNWVKNTYVVKTGSATSVILKWSTEASNPGTILLDDIVMSKAGGEGGDPIPVDGLQNGDFETGDESGWTVYQGTAVKGDAKKNGSYGLHLTGNGGWGGMAFQDIPVTANQEYILTMWAKTLNNGANIQVLNGPAGSAVLASNWFTAKDWTKLEFSVVPTGNTLCLNLCGAGNGVSESVYIDDVTLSVKGEEPPTPPGGDENTSFKNGDFELGNLDGWTPWQNTEISAAAKKNGSYGAVLKGDGSWGGLLDQNFTVEAGKTYTLSFWHKANAGGANFVVKDNGTQLASYWGNATAWTQFTLEFTANGTNLLLNICGGGDGVASEVFVDDFVLAEKTGGEPDTPPAPPEPPAPGAEFQNGDFETGDLTGWTAWQNTEISADAKKNGSYGAKLVGDGGWGGLLDQTFAVEAGKIYVLSFWYKANAGGANFVVKENGTGIASSWCNATSWTQITLEFTPATTSLLLNICGGGDGVAAEVFVDDFVLAMKPSVQMGLINGDFEDGTNGWTLNADSKLETSDVHAGNGALYVSAAGQYGEAAYQVMGLEPGTDYVVTWYGKRVSGTGAYCIFLMNEKDLSNLQGVDGQTWMNESSGDWVKYEITFNSGSVTELRMKWAPEIANAGAVLVDDITLLKAGEEPVDPTGNLIKNGSFEKGKDDWTWGGESAVIDGDGNFYEGAHSAKLVNNSAWGVGVQQVVNVEKNTDYVLRFYTKRITGKGVWVLSLMDADTVDITNVNLEVSSGQKWFDHTTTNKWEEHVIEFNSGEVDKVLVKLGPESDNAGSFMLDYVGMWVKGNEPSPDDPDSPVVPPKADMFMTSFGVLNNRPISQDNNLLENPSFEKSGGQWKEGFKGNTISVVKDKTTEFGSKSLFFNTAGIEEETKLVFWIDVQPDTSYVFSTWLKGAYLADDNRGLATIGIVNENGKFLSMYQENDITRFLNGERQLVPTAWDNEWHIRGMEFNTGECTKVGIALAGKNSQMWVDDMALFAVGDGKKYMSPNAGGSIALSYSIDDITCKDKDSLIPDPTFSKGSSDFWKTSYGWRNGFLTFAKNKYEYGTSLKYTASGDNAPLSIIKTIEVEPNTDYTFAVDVKILEDGWGKLMLCDGKIREPISFMEVSFDSYDYNTENSHYGWYTTVCKFNTDAYDSISLVIVDDGGEALLDNMRLFKSEDGDSSVVDKFVAPPEEPTPEEEQPTDDGWYEGDDYYPEYPVEPDVPVEDEPIEEPDIFDEPVDEPEPVPTDPVAPVVKDQGNNAWIWVAIGGGAALLAGGGVFLFFFLKKKKTAPTPPADAE